MPTVPNIPKADDQYLSGQYWQRHDDFHLNDSPDKVCDIWPGMQAILAEMKNPGVLRIADVGAGVGGVLHGLRAELLRSHPNMTVHACAVEISATAVEQGRNLFPELVFLNKSFTGADGPQDVVMLIDVLEHMENPWELLRAIAQASPFLIVRQPLCESFSNFRHNAYGQERKTLGHIMRVNYRSFMDMMLAAGWTGLHLKLCPPWKLAGAKPVSRLRSLVLNTLDALHPQMASYFLSGYYVVGAFRRSPPDA